MFLSWCKPRRIFGHHDGGRMQQAGCHEPVSSWDMEADRKETCADIYFSHEGLMFSIAKEAANCRFVVRCNEQCTTLAANTSMWQLWVVEGSCIILQEQIRRWLTVKDRTLCYPRTVQHKSYTWTLDVVLRQNCKRKSCAQTLSNTYPLWNSGHAIADDRTFGKKPGRPFKLEAGEAQSQKVRRIKALLSRFSAGRVLTGFQLFTTSQFFLIYVMKWSQSVTCSRMELGK